MLSKNNLDKRRREKNENAKRERERSDDYQSGQ